MAARIKIVGGNQIEMEVPGLFLVGEELDLGGRDFVSNSSGRVSSVLGQHAGKSRIRIEIQSGGLTPEAHKRVIEEMRSMNEAFNQRTKKVRNPDLEPTLEELEEEEFYDEELPQVSGAYRSGAAERRQQRFSESRQTERGGGGIEGVLNGMLNTGGISTSKKARADRPVNVRNKSSYYSKVEHVESMRKQAEGGDGSVTPLQDERVGKVGGQRRSQYARNRSVLTDDEVREQARQGMKLIRQDRVVLPKA